MQVNEKQTIVVVGGGYAGIHAVNSLRKEFASEIGKSIRLVLLDKEPYHFERVLMVKAPVRPSRLQVPFAEYGWQDVEILRGCLTAIHPECNELEYEDAAGQTVRFPYHRAVLALGSVVRTRDVETEGIVLRNENDVLALQKKLQERVDAARAEACPLNVAVVGGGISGIETSAELASFLNSSLRRADSTSPSPTVTLVHAGDRLLPEAPVRVGRRLEKKLMQLGVRILYSEGRSMHRRDTAARRRFHGAGGYLCVDVRHRAESATLQIGTSVA